MDNAPCRSATNVFFGDIWPDLDEPADPDALEFARSVCLSCPFRKPCAVMVMEDERSKAAVNRFGLAATLTPYQRWVLEKRDTLRCEKCHVTLDPDDVRRGILSHVACKNARKKVAPIPDDGSDGSDWQPRHTTLAHRTLEFVRSHEPGDKLPSATTLADRWGVRRNDVVRVYAEFEATEEIARKGNVTAPCYVRLGGTTGAWHPLHLTS